MVTKYWNTLYLYRNDIHNFRFEADAVRQRIVSCYVGGPRRSIRRYARYMSKYVIGE